MDKREKAELIIQTVLENLKQKKLNFYDYSQCLSDVIDVLEQGDEQNAPID